jgi:hypothetical protein
METGKKIAVGLAAALLVAIFAAGAVSMAGAIEGPIQYCVVVLGSPDVTVELGEGGLDFGSLSSEADTTLSESLVLTNAGEATAKVEAKFTTCVEEETGDKYGLVMDDTEVLPASDFKLGTTENELALDDEGAEEDLGEPNYVPAGGFRQYNAKLSIPAGQAAGIYLGTVELIISAA